LTTDDPSADFGKMPFDAIIASIASTAPSSGAGIAAALSLALAIACARKAVGISLRHFPGNTTLEGAQRRLEALSTRALVAAQQDARLFAAHLQHPDEHTTARLAEAEKDSLRVSQLVAAELDALHDAVTDVMRADIDAAVALLAAATAIERGLNGP
jgi:hypothetical protein